MIREKKSMAEIHAIMERLHDKRAGMSGAEVVRDIREGAVAAKKKYGVTLTRPDQKKNVVSR